MRNNPSRVVTAVIVALDPDPGTFLDLLHAIAPQVSGVVVVDNSADRGRVASLLRAHSPDHCVLIANGRNIGLAAAQNRGIDHALRAGADHVLLLDHDSVPAHDMVERLADALGSAAQAGDKCAAAGPAYAEVQSQSESRFVQLGRLGMRRVRCDAAALMKVRADLLIASGMLIPAQALREIGMMDEALFVDHVDTDWCWRARDKGYRMLGVCGARLAHRLGDRPGRSIAGRRFFIRSPARHYFFFRNSLLLYRRAYPPTVWKIGDALRLLPLAVAALMFCTPRMRHMRAIARGVVDGLRGRSGPLPPALET
jgi:rhamnosyltransferase